MKNGWLVAAAGACWGVCAAAAEAGATTSPDEQGGTNGAFRVLVLADPIYQSYQTRTTESYARIPVDPMVLPASVNQVSQKVLNDVGALSTREVTAYTPGVYNFSDEQHLYSFAKFHLRGFAQPNAWRDGMRSYGNNVVDLDSLESFDVVKGPNSAQSGYAEVGGYINYVTKGASLDDDGYRSQTTLRAQNTGLWKATAETGGKVDDGLATYLQVGVQNGETFRARKKDLATVTGGVAAQLDDDTVLDVRGTYTHERRDPDYGVPFVNGRRVGGVHKYWSAYGSLDGLEIDEVYGVATLTHAFSSSLSSRSKLSFHEYRCDMDALRFPSWNGALGSYVSRYDASRMSLFEMQGNEDVTWTWEGVDGLRNTLVGGFEGHVSNYRWARRWYNNAAAIDWALGRYVANGAPALLAGRAQRTNCYSFAPYVQDEAVLFDQLHVMGGLRWDWVQQENAPAGGGAGYLGHDDHLSGNVGVLWEALDWLHPYFSYSTSFQPQMPGTLLAGGGHARPEEGEQFEVGVKMPVCDNLQLGAAAYHIEKRNVARMIGTTGFWDIDGEYRSNGLELTAQGELGRHVEVLAAYAWNDPEAVRVAASSGYRKGSMLVGVPRNAGSLWGVWHMEGVRSPYGLRAGAGVQAMSSRGVDEAGAFDLGGYCTLNAVVGYGYEYATKRLCDFQVNFYNLTDADYYDCASSGTGGNYWAMPGAPFGVMFTVRVTF